MEVAESGLDAAVGFYVNGFERTHHGINNIIAGKRTRTSGQDELIDEGNLWALVIQLGYTLIFWFITLLLLGAFSLNTSSNTPKKPTSSSVEEKKSSVLGDVPMEQVKPGPEQSDASGSDSKALEAKESSTAEDPENSEVPSDKL